VEANPGVQVQESGPKEGAVLKAALTAFFQSSKEARDVLQAVVANVDKGRLLIEAQKDVRVKLRLGRGRYDLMYRLTSFDYDAESGHWEPHLISLHGGLKIAMPTLATPWSVYKAWQTTYQTFHPRRHRGRPDIFRRIPDAARTERNSCT